MPAPFAPADAPRSARLRSRAWCATCRNCASATRWCTPSTASAAISASPAWTLEKARPSSCIWSTRAKDKLYVPVAQLHLISRYSGVAPEQAPLHKLGSGDWDRAKKKAAQQIRDTAAELLNLYARRAARQGHQFEVKQHDLDAFAEGFGFEETPDQAAAIRAVIEDMCSGKPMDRLICGDVGFGKTEVALRAAFVAVCGGKQVAVLTRPPCWQNSISRRSPTASRRSRTSGRSRSPSCRAFAPPRSRRKT